MSFLKDKFCKLSATKVQEGVFTGRDIRWLIKDESFDSVLNLIEKNAWK